MSPEIWSIIRGRRKVIEDLKGLISRADTLEDSLSFYEVGTRFLDSAYPYAVDEGVFSDKDLRILYGEIGKTRKHFRKFLCSRMIRR